MYVSSSFILILGRVSTDLMHSTDWLPTLLHVAGIEPSVAPAIDGVDVWSMISVGYSSQRFEIFHNFDPLQSNQAALRVGDYKLIINQDIGYFGDWYPRPVEVEFLFKFYLSFSSNPLLTNTAVSI